MLRYFCILLFNFMSLTSSVHFPFRAHLSLDCPGFTQQPHIASGYYIGQCRFKEFPRGKGIGVALPKPGHKLPSALTCEFQGGIIASMEDLSQFQDNLQTCIPSNGKCGSCLMFCLLVCLVFQEVLGICFSFLVSQGMAGHCSKLVVC